MATRLRSLIASPTLLVMPAAYDALSARLIEEAGFEAVQCSGLGVATAAGLPDFSVVSLNEMAERTRTLVRAVDIPVMGDADTGYGNAVNAWYCTREFEAIGAAGMNIEDQVFPKRCGRVAGKELVTVDEMVLKVQSVVHARRSDDFVVNARTDALSVEGIDAAIQRSNAYLNAGATMVFVTGVSTLGEVERLTHEIRGPVGLNMIEQDSLRGQWTFSELQERGVARVSLSASMMLAAIQGMRVALKRIREWDGTHPDPEVYAPFADLHKLGGMEHATWLERRFVKADASAAEDKANG